MMRRIPLLNCYACWLLIPAAFLVSVGCKGSDDSNGGQAESNDEDVVAVASPSTETTSVSSANSANEMSPAAGELTTTATPDQVCREFMKLLQSGNRIAAENLLTRAALMITTRSELHLEAMGGPTAVYSVIDIRYATEKNKLAQVECLVTDSEGGVEYSMPVTWVVRKQRSGWRISGVLLELEPGQALDLLSFENVQDVTKMKNMAGDVVLEGPDLARQADAEPNSIIK